MNLSNASWYYLVTFVVLVILFFIIYKIPVEGDDEDGNNEDGSGVYREPEIHPDGLGGPAD